MNIAPLIEHFADERGQMIPPAAVNDRRILAAFLTVREPGPIPHHITEQIDTLLVAEAAERGSTQVDALPTLAEQGVASCLVAERMSVARRLDRAAR
jgi:hypothetical protein